MQLVKKGEVRRSWSVESEGGSEDEVRYIISEVQSLHLMISSSSTVLAGGCGGGL